MDYMLECQWQNGTGWTEETQHFYFESHEKLKESVRKNRKRIRRPEAFRLEQISTK